METTKQEQINEMLLYVPRTIVAYDANPKGQHLYGEQRRQIAVALYDVGYRKVPDDIKELIDMLSEGANKYKNLEIKYSHLCDNYRLCKDANETLKQNVIAARKETAEKIFGDLWNTFVEYSSYAMDYTQHLGEYDKNINISVSDVICDIICIAKNYGVDLEVEE